MKNFSHLLLLTVMLCGVLVPLSGYAQSPSSPALKPAAASISVIPPQSATNEPAERSAAATAGIPIYTYEVVNIYPHDPGAFTQGLLFLDGALLESMGLHGQSSLRKVELKTGRVLKHVEVPEQYFAEGLAVLTDKVFQLTWQDHKVFIYDLKSLRLEREFPYESEGWGLTTDGQWLILSDGTDQIRFLDPLTFEVKRTIRVQTLGLPVDRLNELEYIKGEIFANVWDTDYVVRIDPVTGRVFGVIDFSGLLAAQDRRENNVLNGIAYDAVEDRLFVTGKRWPKLFEVRLKLSEKN